MTESSPKDGVTPAPPAKPQDNISRELDLREREIAVKEGELKLKHEEQADSKWSNPLVLAIIAASVAASGNALVTYLNNRNALELQDKQTRTAAEAETHRDEAARILEALKLQSTKDTFDRMDFLVRSGLIKETELAKSVRYMVANRGQDERFAPVGEAANVIHSASVVVASAGEKPKSSGTPTGTSIVTKVKPPQQTSDLNSQNAGTAASSSTTQEDFDAIRTDELKLSRAGEAAFSAHKYDLAIKYLEQARTVSSSGVWQSSYPYLIGAYLIKGQDTKADTTISEMFSQISQPYGYLTNSIPLGFLIRNFGVVRPAVPTSSTPLIDKTIDKIIEMKRKLNGI